MRFSDDVTLQAFLEVYDDATEEDREHLPLEAFAIMAEVDAASFVYAAILAMSAQAANIAKIVAVSNHPKVMQATVDNALLPKGSNDRHMIHTMLRALPQKKDVVNFILSGGQMQPNGNPVIEADDIDTRSLFPELETTQKLLED
jgi:hypothetical protein